MVSDLLGNEIFNRLRNIQEAELKAAMETTHKLRRGEPVPDGDLLDALYEFAIRLDVTSPLLPVCHETIKRFMVYGGITETSRGLRREWLDVCPNPNCVDGKISTGRSIDGPLLVSECPDCVRRRANNAK